MQVILLAFLMPLIGFTQNKPVVVIWYENETRYCLSEEQALLTVELDRENEINKDKIIDLEGKITALDEKDVAKDVIIEATEAIVVVEKERTEMTKKELRQEKRKAVGQWFKDKWQMLVISTGTFGVGVGVGLGVGL